MPKRNKGNFKLIREYIAIYFEVTGKTYEDIFSEEELIIIERIRERNKKAV